MTNPNDDGHIIDPERLTGEYDDSQDFATSPQPQEETVVLDQETIAIIEQMKTENLPQEDKEGNHWVSEYQYGRLYSLYVDAEDALAIRNRDYDRAYEQNRILRASNDKLTTANNELKAADRASTSFNESKARELEKKEKELETREKRQKPYLYTSIGLAALATILCLVFGSLWLSSRTDEASIGQRDAAQQEQVRGLRTSLEQEREDHNKTRGELDKINNQVNSLTDDLNAQKSETDKLREEVTSKDSEISRINSDLESVREENTQLSSREPETVTRTFVQQQEGQTQTETRTVTTTVSESNE